MAHQRAATELADAMEGRRRLEDDRRAAGGAVGAEKGMEENRLATEITEDTELNHLICFSL
jgi:hypothetical protein